MVGAGEWQLLENGSCWRMVGAGEWQSLEDGRRWRMAGAGGWLALENGRRYPKWSLNFRAQIFSAKTCERERR
jgi:hypothetical protein